jgi:hypothetical protein
MKVGIVINNILRDYISNLVRTYERYTGNEAIQPIDPYNLDPSFPLSGEDENEIKSVQHFIHIDAPLEILGGADETELGIIQKLNVLQTEIEDELVLINRDSIKGRSATLFFLSKHNFGLNEIKFPDTYEGCWDGVDMIITDHPDIMDAKPENKILIKLEGDYNKEYNADYTITKPGDIFDRKETFFTIKQIEKHEQD